MIKLNLSKKEIRRQDSFEAFDNTKLSAQGKKLLKEWKKINDMCHDNDIINYIIRNRNREGLPVEYEIIFKLNSIVGVEEATEHKGKLIRKPIYGNEHHLSILLPNNYPSAMGGNPEFKMLTDTWHPNIRATGKFKGRICQNDKDLGIAVGLDERIIRVGKYLQFQMYWAHDTYPWPEDKTVAEWIREEAELMGWVNAKEGIFTDNSKLRKRQEKTQSEDSVHQNLPSDTEIAEQVDRAKPKLIKLEKLGSKSPATSEKKDDTASGKLPELKKLETDQQEKEKLEAERIEAERLKQERIEAERIEKEKLEAERIEKERIEAERKEQEKLEAERIEKERLEAERIEQERLEAERVEKERIEAERLEQESLEAERIEKERLEAERIEQERLEAERIEKERLEAERIEKERLEAERLEQERLEAERIEKERIEAERIEQEKLEVERIEKERLEQERIEAERLEQERIEAEKLEQERLEAEKKEQERLEAERIEKERLEAERIEKERLEAERIEKEKIEAERLEQERIEAERIEKERLEAERIEKEKLEAERIQAEIESLEKRKAEHKQWIDTELRKKIIKESSGLRKKRKIIIR